MALKISFHSPCVTLTCSLTRGVAVSMVSLVPVSFLTNSTIYFSCLEVTSLFHEMLRPPPGRGATSSMMGEAGLVAWKIPEVVTYTFFSKWVYNQGLRQSIHSWMRFVVFVCKTPCTFWFHETGSRYLKGAVSLSLVLHWMHGFIFTDKKQPKENLFSGQTWKMDLSTDSTPFETAWTEIE